MRVRAEPACEPPGCPCHGLARAGTHWDSPGAEKDWKGYPGGFRGYVIFGHPFRRSLWMKDGWPFLAQRHPAPGNPMEAPSGPSTVTWAEMGRMAYFQ